MFRRKEEENESTEANEVKSTEKSASPSTASNNNTTGTSTVSAAASMAAPAPRPAENKPAPTPAQPASAYRPAPTPAARPAGFNAAPASNSSHSDEKSKKRILTVGNDILLKGEIATCDRLVIEGAVDAKLNDVHTVEIAETGSFKGSAQIEDAEISGLFEGDLVVRNRLIIYSTGKVRGKITYGEIEIERGGEMTGEIKTGTSAASESKEDKEKSKAA